MFKPDQPIQSNREDILGRYPFAKALGNAILSYKDKNSIVIGLFGAWGSGKTSIVNMTIEHIDTVSKSENCKHKPIIIRFNPWNYSDQEQLVGQFFRQLSVTLRRIDYADDAKKAGEQVETYAKFFEPLVLIPHIGMFALLFSKVFKSVGKATKNWGDLKANDLNAIRTKLNELLSKQPHKIIIVVDDIDRLNDNEIRQIFQLIKSLGDFPNTIYLLSFDKKVVISALAKVQEGSGLAYLEKVVQVPFEVPLISKEEVDRFLLSQLDLLIKDIPEDKWDATYWGNIYHSGLRQCFNNIRDVTRYLNSLRFSFGIVKGKVHPTDFLAITAIQVFMPEVYCGIRDNKDIFAGASEGGESTASREQSKKRCNEILSRANNLEKEDLEDLLKRLFPKLEAIYGGSNYNHSWLKNWRRDCRICHPEIFDRFFKLSLAKGEISQEEMEIVLSLGDNVDEFREALLKFNEDGRGVTFLEQLEDYTEKQIPAENVETIITALMDIGDLFPDDKAGMYEFGTPMKILRVFYQLSHRFNKQEDRFNIFRRATEKATRSLYTIVDEVGVQAQQHGKYHLKNNPVPVEERTVNEAQLIELEKMACHKIEEWAKDGRLKKHSKVIAILFRWSNWGSKEKVDNFIKDMIRDDDGLVGFITGFLGKSFSHGMSDRVAKMQWRIDLKAIDKLVDSKELEPRVRKIFSSQVYKTLESKKQLAIQTFLDTFDGKINDWS